MFIGLFSEITLSAMWWLTRSVYHQTCKLIFKQPKTVEEQLSEFKTQQKELLLLIEQNHKLLEHLQKSPNKLDTI